MSRAADGLDAETRPILFGTDEAPPASIALRAGPLTMHLGAGTPVRQGMELSVEGVLQRHRPAGAREIPPEQAAPRPLPRLGLVVAPGDADADLRLRAAARLRPSVLHATIGGDDLAAAAPALAEPAGEAGAPLQVDLAFGDGALAGADLAALRSFRPEAVSLFPSRPEAVAAGRRALSTPGAHHGVLLFALALIFLLLTIEARR